MQVDLRNMTIALALVWGTLMSSTPALAAPLASRELEAIAATLPPADYMQRGFRGGGRGYRGGYRGGYGYRRAYRGGYYGGRYYGRRYHGGRYYGARYYGRRYYGGVYRPYPRVVCRIRYDYYGVRRRVCYRRW